MIRPVMLSEEQIARFWAKVNILGPDDCWEWTASIKKKGYGYGQFNLNGRMTKVHRVAWELTHGPIPEGLCCCHICDNKKCVNPKHLFLGTQQDNIDDMVTKGRNFKPIGTKNNTVKLTEEQVIEIRRLYALENHMFQREIALLFGVSQGLIGLIVNGKRWGHI
jgi:predicted XRE-type DNA-binding protein